ncbi:MAG: hypothetical protein ACLTNO_08860 [Blautia sp.]
MGEFKLTTVEEFEEATNRLLETGAKVGADSWQLRVKNQTPHCKFGEQGICCRICSMGPCRITENPQNLWMRRSWDCREEFLRFTWGRRHIPTMAGRSATPPHSCREWKLQSERP